MQYKRFCIKYNLSMLHNNGSKSLRRAAIEGKEMYFKPWFKNPHKEIYFKIDVLRTTATSIL